MIKPVAEPITTRKTEYYALKVYMQDGDTEYSVDELLGPYATSLLAEKAAEGARDGEWIIATKVRKVVVS